MDTLKMFALEQYDQDAPQQEGDETESGARDVPARDRIHDHAGTGEEQVPDGTEVPVHNQQEPNGLESEATGTGEHVGVERTPSIYESTGLAGPFELSPEALIFPHTPQGDLNALAANISANGLLKEPTVAGNPPMVIDGKRRLLACEIAGVRPTFRLLRQDFDHRVYLWAMNGERRDLSPSQKALAFAELFPKLGPGRPPGPGENCQIFDNLSTPTQGQGAKKHKVSRPLINEAYKVADPNGRVAPEVREAVRDGTVSVSDAVKDNVSNVSQEVQREALSLVKQGKSRTLSAAIEKVAKERLEREDEPLSKFDPPTTLGKTAKFHRCSVADLKKRVKPGTVDLIVAHPPEWARIGYFSEIGALANHALTEDGVMVVAVVATGALPEMLDRLSRGGPEFIAEFSLLFPAPIAELGDPHYTEIRRAALLTFGKSGAKLPPGGDVIEVPAPADDPADGLMEIKDGLPLVVARFASRGQTLCILTLTDNGGAVVAALAAGCTVIGADEDQSVIDDVVRRVSEPMDDSSPDDPESE